MRRFTWCVLFFYILVAVSPVFAEAIVPRDFDLSAYSYEELLKIIDAADEKARVIEQQYAIENGNRKITFDKEAFTLYTGNTLKLKPTVNRIVEDAPRKTTLVWSTSDKTIAKIATDGTVTALKTGDVMITCTAKDDENIFTSVSVQVVVPVKSVALSQSKLSLLLGGSEETSRITLTAVVDPENAFCQTLIWSSSNEAVVTVNEAGEVQALRAGKAKISAAPSDGTGKAVFCSVTVGQSATSIKLTDTKLTLGKGKTTTLKASVLPENASSKKVTWTSSNEKIAKVSAEGKVTAVSCGKSYITCTAADGSGVSCTVEVTVVQSVTKVALSESTVALRVGTTKKIYASLTPNDATDKTLSWKSSDPTTASVSADGQIKGISQGSCTVTCTAKDGSKKSDSVKVFVEADFCLEITNVKLGHNSIGSPEIYVSVKNNSQSRSIIAFTFATRCYDAYGNLLKAHGFGDTTEYWIWQEGTIKPQGKWSSGNWRWVLYGFDTAYRIDVWLTDIRTSDNKTISILRNETPVWSVY